MMVFQMVGMWAEKRADYSARLMVVQMVAQSVGMWVAWLE